MNKKKKKKWNKRRYRWIAKMKWKTVEKINKFNVQIMTANFFLPSNKNNNEKKKFSQNAPFLVNINLIILARSSQRVVLYTYVIGFHLLTLNPYVSKRVSFIPRNDDNASWMRPERVTNEDSRRVTKRMILQSAYDIY